MDGLKTQFQTFFIYGDVQLKHDRMSLKISCYFVGYSRKNRGVLSFTILALDVSLKHEMHISLRILNLMGEI